MALFLLLLGAFMLLPIYYTVVNFPQAHSELFLFPPRLYVTSPPWIISAVLSASRASAGSL